MKQLPPITNKQQQILLHIYRFRFLTRIHIQQLLNHKSHRRINEWLNDLTDKNYISRIFERQPGINLPAIYYISKNGISFLRTLEECEKGYIKKLYREKDKSKTFINQSTLIAGIYLDFVIQQPPGFKFYTQMDFPQNGIIRELNPTFAYVKELDDTIQNYIAEIIKPRMPRYAIRALINKYAEFFDEIDVESINLIFLCPDEKLRKYVNNQLKNDFNQEISVTTKIY